MDNQQTTENTSDLEFAIPEGFPLTEEELRNFLAASRFVDGCQSRLSAWALAVINAGGNIDPNILALISDKKPLEESRHLHLYGEPPANLPEVIRNNHQLLLQYQETIAKGMSLTKSMQAGLESLASKHASSTETVAGYTDIQDPRFVPRIVGSLMLSQKARRHRVIVYKDAPSKTDPTLLLHKELRYTREPEGGNIYGLNEIEMSTKPDDLTTIKAICHFDERTNSMNDIELQLNFRNLVRYPRFEQLLHSFFPPEIITFLKELRESSKAEDDCNINLKIVLGNISSNKGDFISPKISFSVTGRYHEGSTDPFDKPDYYDVNVKGSYEFSPADEESPASSFKRNPRVSADIKVPHSSKHYPSSFNQITPVQYEALISTGIGMFQGTEVTTLERK